MSLFKFSRAQTASAPEATAPITPSSQEVPQDSALGSILGSALKRQNAPLTRSITPSSFIKPAPQAPKTEPMTLFSDEQEIKDKMIADGIDELQAENEIKARRKELFGGDAKILPKEAEILKNMRDDGVPASEAVKMIQARREETGEKPEEKKMSLGQQAFNVPVGAAALATEQVGNVLDFVTGGRLGFGEEVKAVKEINKPLEGTFGYQAGRNILGVGESIAATPAKWMGSGMAATLPGRIAQGATVGGYQGAAMPVLDKGSEATAGDIATSGLTGAAVGALAVPAIEKVVAPAIGIAAKGVTKWVQALGQRISGMGKGAAAKVAEEIPAKNVFGESIAPVELEQPGVFGKAVNKIANRLPAENDLNNLVNRALGTKQRGATSADRLQKVSEKGYVSDLEALHGLVASGRIEGDLNSVYGGAVAVQNALKDSWQKIGNYLKQAGIDPTVEVKSAIEKLDKILSDPREALANQPMINVAQKYKELLEKFPDLENIQKTKQDIFQDIGNLKKENAGRQSYKDLVDAGNEIIKSIDTKVEKAGLDSADFIREKKIYRSLKNIEKDITDSAIVAEKSSPQGLAEQLADMQIGYDALTDPTSAVAKKLGRDIAKAVADRNSRDGTFRRAMEIFNERAKNRGVISSKVGNKIPQTGSLKVLKRDTAKTPKSLDAIIAEGKKTGVDMEKYLSNVSETSANKMADHAYKYAVDSALEGKNTLDFDKIAIINDAMSSGKEGKIATVGDIIKDSYLRKLYKDALNTPIEVSTAGGTTGSVGEFVIEGPKKGTIIFRPSAETTYNLADTLLHEAAHAIRLTKGRAMANDYTATNVLKKVSEEVKKTKPKGLNSKKK